MSQELENRKCILTGSVQNKEDLLRFVLLKDGTLLPDFDKKLPGRGFYFSNSKQLLEDLVNKNKESSKNPLNKVLHTKVLIPDDLPEMIEKILEKKALNSLNLARKSGTLILGFEKIKEAVLKKRISFIITALDAGADGKSKLEKIAGDLQKVELFTTEVMSAVLNRDNTVYLAIVKGNTEKMVYKALNKYATYLKA